MQRDSPHFDASEGCASRCDSGRIAASADLFKRTMNLPTDLKYAPTHEWARLDADGIVTVGISDHAQTTLGDVVFIELPALDRVVKAGEEISVIESVKAASGIHAPLAGSIVAVNQDVVDAPETINDAPYASWLFRIQPNNPADLAALLDASAYAASVD